MTSLTPAERGEHAGATHRVGAPESVLPPLVSAGAAAVTLLPYSPLPGGRRARLPLWAPHIRRVSPGVKWQ